MNSVAQRLSIYKTLTKALSITVIVVGSFVLVGWLLDITLLKSIFPTLVTMKANTAVAFILSGVSLLLFQHYKKTTMKLRRIAQTCAFFVALIGLLTLSEYALNIDIGIDQLLFEESREVVGTFSPGRMAPNTALNFLIVGVAFLLLDVKSRLRYHPSELLAISAGFIAWVSLNGYIFGVESLYGISFYTQMALHTSLLFIVLSMGILFSRPYRGFMEKATGDGAGGVLIRRFLPLAIVFPMLFSWVRLKAQQAGWVSPELGAFLLVMSTVVTLVFLILWNARKLSHSEKELRNAEARYRITLDNMLEGCQIIGYDWRYLYINDVAAHQGKRNKEELLGHTMTEMYPGIDTTEMYGYLKRCMEQRIPHRMENEFTFPDGSTGWFRLNIKPVPEGIFILSEDITNERNLTEALKEYQTHLEELVKERTAQLEAANKELEAFSYSVSHDLRAPLRHIDGFVELLQKHASASLDEKSRRYLDIISTSAKQMGVLIDDLLVFSRMGREEMQRLHVSTDTLVRETISSLSRECSGRTINWNITSLPVIEADPSMMSLVFHNLISNALKYTRTRSVANIEIGCSVDNNTYVFFIRDNGVGFDMKYIDKLFGVFQRLHRVEDFDGTGIGLANVRRIVQRHGGKTWAEGEVGKGATFYFSFPQIKKDNL